MKKLLTLLLAFLFIPSLVGAQVANVPWARVGSQLRAYWPYTNDHLNIGSTTMATSTTDELFTVTGDAGIKNYFYVGPFAYDGLSAGLNGTFDPNYFIADFTAQEGHPDYAAVSLNNFNNGTSSSIDLTFNNDLTSDIDGDGEFSYYCDMGMNSSQYNNSFYGLQNVPNMGYWYCKDSPVSIASATSSATAGYINFLTGGWAAEAMRITNTGAVGIGSTSPSARLVVTNPLSTQSFIVEDQATDTTPFVIDPNGNVSVGSTTVPTGRFSVSCTGATTGTCIYVKNSSNFDTFRVTDIGNAVFGRNVTQLTATPINVSYGGSYGNGSPGTVTNLKWDLYNDGTNRYGIGMSAALMELRAAAGGAIGIYPGNGTHSATFASSGNVGIATTTPGAKLTVQGASSGTILSLFSNAGTKFLEMLNTGVTTLLGEWDFGGATSVEIPNGSAPTVNATGEIAVDTTSDQLIYYGASTKRVSTFYDEKSLYIASTTQDKSVVSFSTGTSTFEVANFYRAVTLDRFYCKTDTGTLLVRFGDGTNWTSSASCTSSGVEVSSLSNNTFTTREDVQVQVGTAASTPNKVTITASFLTTAD